MPRTVHLQMGRKGRGKLDDTVIQERRTDLHGMGHAHAVHFHQDVIRQIVFLIKPKIRGQRMLFSQPPAQFGQHVVKTVGQRRRDQVMFLHFRKGAVPMDVGAAGRK